MDAHNKHVKEAVDANADDPVKVGLEKSGIAGTETVTDADKEGKDDSDKKEGTDKPTENGDKKDDAMEVIIDAALLSLYKVTHCLHLAFHYPLRSDNDSTQVLSIEISTHVITRQLTAMEKHYLLKNSPFENDFTPFPSTQDLFAISK